MSGQYGKNRQWWGVLYNENMRPDWKEAISEIVQLPFAYCVHDKGLELEDGAERKVHTHLILVWNSPTTQKHAAEVFNQLSAEGKRCFSAIKPVYGARNVYDYLIHDTEDAKKKGKYQFSPSERITGNNYDIGNYEQVSKEEKDEAFDNMTDMILGGQISNFADFIYSVKEGFQDEWNLYRDVLRTYSAYFEKLIKGNYHRMFDGKLAENGAAAAPAGEDHARSRREILANLKEEAAEARERGYQQLERDAIENEEYAQQPLGSLGDLECK